MAKIISDVWEIIEKYQYSRELRKYADKHFFNDNSYFRKVNSNQDVERAKAGIYNRLEQYKKVFPLVQDDIIDLERAAAQYEIAVKKVIQCWDNPHTDFNYSVEEFQGLIELAFECHDKVNELVYRKAMQD
ncbi:hypothetical protein [Paenibacillus paridis]|uniref:hypothetical protein n=1 Tax=Paenibacillus paridis TaxID=2583376 RepID=UPI001123FCE0|nr:hypothetical protein [Paenibacillus paridis]